MTRLPPHNLEAEQATLGSMMIDKLAMFKGLEILRPEDFYRPTHQLVFGALGALAKNDSPVDVMTVTEELKRRKKLEDAGGTEYLFTLVETVPTAANLEHYARIVENKGTLRRLIAVGTEIMALGHDEETDTDQVVDRAQNLMIRLQKRDNGTLRAISDVVGEAWEWLNAQQNGERQVGIPWGIKALDQLTYGAEPTAELTLVGARPSNGKTCLLNMVALNAAKQDKRVLFFSLETSARALVTRMILQESGVDGHRFRFKQFGSEEAQDQAYERLATASGDIHNLEDRILIRDIRQPVSSLVATVKAQAIAKGVDLVLLDYLQIIPLGRRAENRNVEIQALTDELKALTQELKVPVIAATQLSRASEKREKSDRKPVLSDLREGGNQEAAADKVILIDNPPPTGDNAPDQRTALLRVAKHKDGPTGDVACWFVSGSMRFAEMEDRY